MHELDAAFESATADNVRDAIYTLSSEINTPEPLKASMRALGKLFNVQTLKDF